MREEWAVFTEEQVSTLPRSYPGPCVVVVSFCCLVCYGD